MVPAMYTSPDTRASPVSRSPGQSSAPDLLVQNANSLSPLVYGFLAKISTDGSKLVYSHLIGGDQMSCQAGPCFGDAARTVANALAVDIGGNAIIAGGTT